MLMPEAKRYKYIIAARDDLSRVSEGQALTTTSSAALAKFFWEQIYCHYGTMGSVVTDNGPKVQKAFRLLLEHMGILQVTISPYNSKANSIVE